MKFITNLLLWFLVTFEVRMHIIVKQKKSVRVDKNKINEK